MIKLKIGNNYLITSSNNSLEGLKTTMAYMMGCFKGSGNVVLSTECIGVDETIYEYARFIRDNNIKKIFLVHKIDVLYIKRKNRQEARNLINDSKWFIKHIIQELRNVIPDIEVKVVNLNAYFKAPEYLLALQLWNELLLDKDSILSVFPLLDRYKQISTRVKQIPEEMKIFANDIERLKKKKDICDRVSSLESLKYLQLIDEASGVGTTLNLTIKELPIYPSEPLGKVFSKETFKRNPYLYKVAKYIYSGCHFGMPKTKIKIGSDFKPVFLETVDHTFDKMFKYYNWSTIGYPHFGVGHFCGGEFNDTIAHAKEYGLEYYFLCLKQYLTTANMRDTAGYRVWWYPIYNEQNELVYCAGVDIAIEEDLKQSPDLYAEWSNKTWDEKVKICQHLNWGTSPIRQYQEVDYYSNRGSEDAFLALLQEKEPEEYKKIMERSAQ